MAAPKAKPPTIHCLYDELVEPLKLKAHPKNRNDHSEEQIERLAKILDYQGYRYPIKVSKLSGFITSGHGRRLAALYKGDQLVPVVYQEYLDENQEYADLTADNAIASWAELDLSGINVDLGDLGPDFDIDLLGIKNFEIDVADKEGLTDEDSVPEHVEPRAKLGDIYKLGEHRLMCGDSTSIDAVEKLIDEQKLKLTFTSPPYNAAATPGGLKHSRHIKYLDWKQDAKSEDQYETFLCDFLSIANRLTEVQIVNLQLLEGGKKSVIRWLAKFVDHYQDQMVWVKSSAAPTPPETITPKHEMLFVFSKELNPNKRIATANFKHFFSVIETSGAQTNEHSKKHKATFPIALCEEVIGSFSKENDSVYDSFGGSGSTLIACEKTNRKCFMMELDPHYVDVIIKRWEEFTGQKAELLNA